MDKIYVLKDMITGNLLMRDDGIPVYFVNDKNAKNFLEQIMYEGHKVMFDKSSDNYYWIGVIKEGKGKYSNLERIEFTNFIMIELEEWK